MLHNCSPLVKTMLFMRVFKLSIAAKNYERSPRNVGRKRSREWCDKDMLEMGEEEFIANFRLSRSAFQKLCQEVGPRIKKEETFANNTVSVERRTALTLYYLGQGVSYRAVANQFGVALPTVCCIVHETTKAIVDIMSPQYIKFPETDVEIANTMATFGTKPLPNCVGVIDGSHIKIVRPNECGTDYYNRKGYYSILVQGVCNGNGKFLSVSCGHPGSIYDARMMRRSGFYKRVLAKRYLNKTYHNVPVVILGDSAYPRLPWLLTPYAGTNLSPVQARFNFAHSSQRIIIEHAFGQLKGRFRILSKQMDVATCSVELITIACCTLHNFCLKEKELFPEEWMQEVQTTEQGEQVTKTEDLDNFRDNITGWGLNGDILYIEARNTQSQLIKCYK